MESQQVSSLSITLTQLVAGTWSVPKNHSLRDVRSEDEFGTVKVWGGLDLSWFGVSVHPPTSTAPNVFFDLLVQGHPKAVAAELVTIQAYDQGLFEAPIAMTLAQGLNWAHHRDNAEHSELTEILDKLYWMTGSFYLCLNYDRYHFSTVEIENLLSAIDATILERDWPAFVQNIEKLKRLNEMNYDPHAGPFVPES